MEEPELLQKIQELSTLKLDEALYSEIKTSDQAYEFLQKELNKLCNILTPFLRLAAQDDQKTFNGLCQKIENIKKTQAEYTNSHTKRKNLTCKLNKLKKIESPRLPTKNGFGAAYNKITTITVANAVNIEKVQVELIDTNDTMQVERDGANSSIPALEEEYLNMLLTAMQKQKNEPTDLNNKCDDIISNFLPKSDENNLNELTKLNDEYQNALLNSPSSKSILDERRHETATIGIKSQSKQLCETAPLIEKFISAIKNLNRLNNPNKIAFHDSVKKQITNNLVNAFMQECRNNTNDIDALKSELRKNTMLADKKSGHGLTTPITHTLIDIFSTSNTTIEEQNKLNELNERKYTYCKNILLSLPKQCGTHMAIEEIGTIFGSILASFANPNQFKKAINDKKNKIQNKKEKRKNILLNTNKTLERLTKLRPHEY